jgi:hypothetical protein
MIMIILGWQNFKVSKGQAGKTFKKSRYGSDHIKLLVNISKRVDLLCKTQTQASYTGEQLPRLGFYCRMPKLRRP